MRKLLIAVIMFCYSGVNAGDKELTFTIQKDTIEADLDGFVLYEYDAALNPSGRTFDVPYTGQTDITHAEVITVLDNAITTLCYKVDAYDTSDNHSPQSALNACVDIDFEAPGGATVTVTIGVVVE